MLILNITFYLGAGVQEQSDGTEVPAEGDYSNLLSARRLLQSTIKNSPIIDANDTFPPIANVPELPCSHTTTDAGTSVTKWPTSLSLVFFRLDMKNVKPAGIKKGTTHTIPSIPPPSGTT